MTDRDCECVEVGGQWIGPGQDAVLESFGGWIARHAWTPGGRQLLRPFCGAVWAVEPEELSALHALLHVHAAGGFDRPAGTEGGGEVLALERREAA